MPAPIPEYRTTEITIIVVLIALLLLLPPLIGLWATDTSYWFSPYLVWAVIIFLSYWLQRHLKKNAV